MTKLISMILLPMVMVNQCMAADGEVQDSPNKLDMRGYAANIGAVGSTITTLIKNRQVFDEVFRDNVFAGIAELSNEEFAKRRTEIKNKLLELWAYLYYLGVTEESKNNLQNLRENVDETRRIVEYTEPTIMTNGQNFEVRWNEVLITYEDLIRQGINFDEYHQNAIRSNTRLLREFANAIDEELPALGSNKD